MICPLLNFCLLLRQAHEKIRRAEALTREGKFAEAAECHEKVADVLSEVHSQISASLIDERTSGDDHKKLISLVPSMQSLITLESLALQRDYHTRQSEVVRLVNSLYFANLPSIYSNFVLNMQT